MVCSPYRKIKGGCSSHQIRNEVIEELLLDGIKSVTAHAREHELCQLINYKLSCQFLLLTALNK